MDQIRTLEQVRADSLSHKDKTAHDHIRAPYRLVCLQEIAFLKRRAARCDELEAPVLCAVLSESNYRTLQAELQQLRESQMTPEVENRPVPSLRCLSWSTAGSSVPSQAVAVPPRTTPPPSQAVEVPVPRRSPFSPSVQRKLR